jgi:hypothetical protein
LIELDVAATELRSALAQVNSRTVGGEAKLLLSIRPLRTVYSFRWGGAIKARALHRKPTEKMKDAIHSIPTCMKTFLIKAFT